LPVFNARNPLKSPDSDEKFQENPSKSKPRIQRKPDEYGQNLQNPRISKLPVRRTAADMSALICLRTAAPRQRVDEPKPAEREQHEKAQRENLDQRPLGGEVEDEPRGSLGPGFPVAHPLIGPSGESAAGDARRSPPLPADPVSRPRGVTAGRANAIVFLLTLLSSSSRQRPPGRERRLRGWLHWSARLRSPKGPAPRFRRRRRVD
jgi:hypothetical protein